MGDSRKALPILCQLCVCPRRSAVSRTAASSFYRTSGIHLRSLSTPQGNSFWPRLFLKGIPVPEHSSRESGPPPPVARGPLCRPGPGVPRAWLRAGGSRPAPSPRAQIIALRVAPSSVVVNTKGRESRGSGFETCSGVVPRRRPCGAAINTLVDLIK